MPEFMAQMVFAAVEMFGSGHAVRGTEHRELTAP